MVGALAEQEGHHPDITFGWGYVEITIFSHEIDGLHENDFIWQRKGVIKFSELIPRLERG